MQFKAVIFAALAALPAVLGASTSGTTTATYSTYYDVPDNSLNGVACSNGENGLITKGSLSRECRAVSPLITYFTQVTPLSTPSPRTPTSEVSPRLKLGTHLRAVPAGL